jgi:hypothetical protein
MFRVERGCATHLKRRKTDGYVALFQLGTGFRIREALFQRAIGGFRDLTEADFLISQSIDLFALNASTMTFCGMGQQISSTFFLHGLRIRCFVRSFAVELRHEKFYNFAKPKGPAQIGRSEDRQR